MTAEEFAGQRFGDLLATGYQLYRRREVEKAAETFTAVSNC